LIKNRECGRESIKLSLGHSKDPAAPPRAIITNRSGAVLGFREEPWIAGRFAGATVAYFETWVIDKVDIICGADDLRWIDSVIESSSDFPFREC
jgi:hypothetical protein